MQYFKDIDTLIVIYISVTLKGQRLGYKLKGHTRFNLLKIHPWMLIVSKKSLSKFMGFNMLGLITDKIKIGGGYFTGLLIYRPMA